MLSILKTVFSQGAATLVEKTTDGLDKLFTSDKERLEAQAIIEQQVHEHFQSMYQTSVDAYKAEDKERTDRHKADMASDSWLSKNIRPLCLIFLLFMYSVLSITDGNIGEFSVKPAFVDLLGTWGMVVMSFYFGGRSLEKIGRVFKSGKTDASDNVSDKLPRPARKDQGQTDLYDSLSHQR